MQVPRKLLEQIRCIIKERERERGKKSDSQFGKINRELSMSLPCRTGIAITGFDLACENRPS